MTKTKVAFALCLLMLLIVSGNASSKGGSEVTLTGQVVCSNCWFEEDRKEKPYGSEDDIACAIRCAKRKVPQALAVIGESETTLYILEPGKAKTDLLKLIGKQVKVTGTVREDGDKKYLSVDSITPVATNTGK